MVLSREFTLSTGRRIVLYEARLWLFTPGEDCPFEITEEATPCSAAERREIAEAMTQRWWRWAGLGA